MPLLLVGSWRKPAPTDHEAAVRPRVAERDGTPLGGLGVPGDEDEILLLEVDPEPVACEETLAGDVLEDVLADPLVAAQRGRLGTAVQQ